MIERKYIIYSQAHHILTKMIERALGRPEEASAKLNNNTDDNELLQTILTIITYTW